jgi:hypothetical protein
VKFSERDGAVSGFAQIVDIGVGTYNLDVTGSRQPDVIVLHLSSSPYSAQPYYGTIDAHVTSETDTLIRGEWRASIGTFGTFRAERQSPVELNAEAVARKTAQANAAFIIMAFTDQASGFLPLEIYIAPSNAAAMRPGSVHTESMN